MIVIYDDAPSRRLSEEREGGGGAIYKSNDYPAAGALSRAAPAARVSHREINSFSESYIHFSPATRRAKESSKKKNGVPLFRLRARACACAFLTLLFSFSALTAGNEQHDRDSLNETGSTTGGTVEGVPGGATPSRGDSRAKAEQGEQAAAQASTSAAQPARSLVSRILSRARSPDHDLLDHSEP